MFQVFPTFFDHDNHLEVFVKIKISKLLAHTRPTILISRINLQHAK